MLTLHNRILRRAGGLSTPLWLDTAFCAGSAITQTLRRSSLLTLGLALAFCAGAAMDTHAQGVPPPNDDLTNAQGIVGASGSVLGTNLFATAETGEPAPFTKNPAQASVWYIWTAPYTTEMDFNTSGSTDTNGNPLDTVLAVYLLKTTTTPLKFADLTLLASNAAYAPASGEVTSRVHVPVTLGATYLIQVDGVLSTTTGTNDRGIIDLNWNPSVQAGAFAFSSAVYSVGQNDNDFLGVSNPGISPSIESPEGGSGARITVIRTDGGNGACEVTFSMSSGFYNNTYETNYTGTNIYETNYDGSGNVIGFTNILFTNVASQNFDQNSDGNMLQSDSLYTVTVSNTDSSSFQSNGFPTTAGLGLLNFFTNFSCVHPSPQITGPILVTNTVTNIFWTNIFCYTLESTVATPSAISGFDYSPVPQTLTFSNFQMSQDIFVPLSPNTGPDDPDVDGNVTYIGINPQVILTLSNPVRDPNDDPDLAPPTISPSAGTAKLNILSFYSDPNNFGKNIHTNNSTMGTLAAVGQSGSGTVPAGMVSINWERATWRVDKNVGTATVYVYASGNVPDSSPMTYNITYSVDYSQNLGALNNNQWATSAGADYAIPFNGLNDYDFSAPTTGWSGNTGTVSISLPSTTPWAAISIPINNNPTTEFESDIHLQLLSVTPGPPGPYTATIGAVSTANLTINYNVQPYGAPAFNPPPPGGSVDVNYNPDHFTGTFESFPIDNPVPGANQTVQAIAMQADGKAIIGGAFTAFDSTPIFGVARLLNTGLQDSSFNPNPGTGVNYLGSVTAIAIDAAGRIIIGGTFTSYNGTNAINIARLTSNGALDTTFLTGKGFNSTVDALAIDANGNILVGGDFTTYNTTNCNHIARLLPNGALDATFLPDTGNGLPNFGTDQDVLALAVDGNGSIVLGGEFNYVNGSNFNYLARLLPSGALDPSFDPEIGPDGTVYSLAVETSNNNEILIGGAFQNYNLVSRSSIALIGNSGALDTGFNPGAGADNTIYSLVLETNGDALIGGQFQNYNGTRRLGVARVLPQGWLDTSFLDTAYNQFAGLPTFYYNAPAQTVFALGVEPSTGNVIVGGAFNQVGGGATRIDVHPRLNLARLLGAPTTNTDRGGIGNDPGNITLVTNNYTVDDIAGTLFVSIDRINGSLGPAMLTLGTNTLPPGPGAASATDFGLLSDATAVATYNEIYTDNSPPLISAQVAGEDYGWKMSDAFWGFNYTPQPQPVEYDNGNASSLLLSISNNPAALQDLFANLSLLNLNSSLTLGGVPIPTLPALGLPGAKLEIINDNFPPGLFGFSVSNYTTVNTSNKIVISVLRTNGNADFVELQYSTKNGTAIANANGTVNDYVAATGTLDFPPGTISNGFIVTIENHSTAQPTKFFNLLLANAALNTGNGLTPFTNAFDTNIPPLLTSNAIVTIIDGNFAPGHLIFTATNFNVLKPGLATVSVQRIGGALGQLTVQCGASDGTAINGLNYIGVTNTLSWGDQDVAVKTMTIRTLQDNSVDGNLTVNLSLFDATNVGSINNDNSILNGGDGPITSKLTILESDSYGTLNFAAPVSFGVPNFNIAQNAGQALITVVRTSGITGTDFVNFATATDIAPPPGYQPAQAGVNYGATSGTLTFLPGVTSQTFIVPVYYNTAETVVTNRIVTLELTNGSANISGQFPKYATLTILDPQLVLNQAGAVDTTTLNGTGFNGFVNSLALQPDGNLLAGGNFTFFNQFPFGYVARINPGGGYDSSFLFDQAGANSNVLQVVSQETNSIQTNDGPIVIAGSFSSVDGINRNGIARLNLDGSLDETFNPGSGADSTVFAVAEALLPTGQANLTNLSYYIGGNFANFDGVPSGGIARVNGSTNSPGYPGTLDANFNVGQGGVASINGAIHALAVQADNSVIAGGDFTSFNSVIHNHLVRLNSAGVVDPTFNPSTGAAAGDSVRAIAIQPDGRILIGGSFTNVTVSNVTYNLNYLARLNTDGSVDTNFNVGFGANNSVLALAIDSQQRILVGGEFTRFSGVTRSGLTRLNPDGTVDPTINFGSGADGGFVDTIAIQNNDEINVGGGFTSFEGVSANNFVRLFGGTIDTSYGSIQFSQPIYGVLQDGTNAVITLERLGGEDAISVVFSTSNDTAVAGLDYTALTTNVTFPQGETFETVLVNVLSNNLGASNKLVYLNLANPTNAVNPSNSVIGVQASAILVITNVNSAVEYSAPTYADSANAGSVSIPIVRIGNPNTTVSVTVYTGANGTATPGVNYVSNSVTLTFNPQVMTNYFNLTLLNASNVFNDQTVDLEMSNPSNTFVGPQGSALLTILNDFTGPGVLAFSQPSYVVSAGAANAVITIVRTNGSGGPVSVTLTTSNGTAIVGQNYVGLNATLHFADGETNESTNIVLLPQPLAGPDTTLYLTLSNPQPPANQGGPTIGGATQEILTIQNEFENFSFGQPSYSTTESNTLNVTVVRGGPATNTATVGYYTYSPANASEANGLAVPNVDYIPVSGTLTFGSNQTQSAETQTIPIRIPQGNVFNGALTFQVVLTNAAATLPATNAVQIASPNPVTVTIISDLTGFQFSASTYGVLINGSNVVITVNRLNNTTQPASVQYATSDGTNQNTSLDAVNKIDYLATNGVLNFLSGQTSNSFSVSILNPNLYSESNTAFNVALSNPLVNSTNTAYLVSPSNATVTITNVLTATTIVVPSPISVTALASSAFLVWSTPISAEVQVAYGLTTNYGSLTSLSGPSTNHVVLLTGLARNATYYFNAVSWFDVPPYPKPAVTNGSFATVDTLILNTGDAYYTGNWSQGSFAITNYYGSSYDIAATTLNNPSSTATYTPAIPTPGFYNVYTWYPTNNTFSTNTQMYVSGASNTIIDSVNQTRSVTINGTNSWQPLAANLYFASGKGGQVVIYNDTGETNKSVVANAMMWSYVDSQDYPSAANGAVPGWWSAFYSNTPAANSNYADYVFGLSPNDPASVLNFSASSPQSNVITASFSPYLGGRTYRLQTSTNLSNPQWLTLTNLPAISTNAVTNSIGIFTNGTGYGVFTVTQTIAQPFFYRLAAQLGTNY